jgi:hypothetical protein
MTRGSWGVLRASQQPSERLTPCLLWLLPCRHCRTHHKLLDTTRNSVSAAAHAPNLETRGVA